MESKHKDILPTAVQLLVDEIEEHCGYELPLRQNPAALLPASFRIDFHAGALGRLAFGIEHRGEMPTWQLAHEVMHAHRYLVEGVPMLYFVEPVLSPGAPAQLQYEFSASNLDNTIEHWVMHPRLAGYGVPSSPNEEDGLQRNVREFAKYQKDRALRSWFFLLRWLNARSLAMPQYEATMRTILQKEGILAKARELEKGLMQSLRCKEASVALVTQALGLSRDNVLLIYMDGRHKRWDAFPMATQFEIGSEFANITYPNGVMHKRRLARVA